MKLLVPTAGPVPARENAQYILEIAKKVGADVVTLHIMDLAEEDLGNEAVKIFEDKARELGVKVKGIVTEGNVVPTIVETAYDEEVSLIVMGASRGRAMGEWIVTDVMDRCQIPVVIIPYRYNR